jgi:hypothetical protein
MSQPRIPAHLPDTSEPSYPQWHPPPSANSNQYTVTQPHPQPGICSTSIIPYDEFNDSFGFLPPDVGTVSSSTHHHGNQKWLQQQHTPFLNSTTFESSMDFALDTFNNQHIVNDDDDNDDDDNDCNDDHKTSMAYYSDPPTYRGRPTGLKATLQPRGYPQSATAMARTTVCMGTT